MPANRHFWAFEEAEDPQAPSVLRLDGVIAEESWFDDEVTPAMFRAELEAHPGDLLVYLNSPGGDVIAGSQIYGMLRDHPGVVTIRIDGLAASAASVIAMAGDVVEMQPTAYMMIHNAWTVAVGNRDDLAAAQDMLAEIDAGIRTAYALRTGLDEKELARMMKAETWMSAGKAIELGFADRIAEPLNKPAPAADPEDPEDPEEPESDPEDRLADQLARIARRFSARQTLPAVAWARADQGAGLLKKLGTAPAEKPRAADERQRKLLKLLCE